jgi:transcriptional regulator with XRE-family HTH domain
MLPRYVITWWYSLGMLNLIAASQDKLSDQQKFKLYRGFLDLTQAQLAEEMGTTQTSVGRWESGISPISLMTMNHLCKLVEVRIMNEARHLFSVLHRGLALSDFEGIGGTPHTGFNKDNLDNLYFGAYFIDGYRKHSLHIRTDDRKWYGLDGQGRAVRVDERFVKSVMLTSSGELKTK